jgi:DNA polymerase-3 subunit delta'
MLKNNRIVHSYVFYGEDNVSKLMLAKEFAKALICSSYYDDACDMCRSCTTTDNNNNPDIFYIKGTTKTGSIGVQDVKEQIISKSSSKPYLYKYKIFIIKNANSMTVAAQNALLKLIEDPNQEVFIFLTSTKDSLIKPLLSRCYIFSVSKLNDTEVYSYLKKNSGMDNQLLKLYSSIAYGSLERLSSLLEDTGYMSVRIDILNNLSNIHSLNYAKILIFAKTLEDNKDRLKNILDIIVTWYRDLMIYKVTENKDYIINYDYIDKIEELSCGYSVKTLTNLTYSLLPFYEKLFFNIKSTLIIENIVLKLRGSLI